MVGRASHSWIGLLAAALASLGCAGAPPAAGPTSVVVECPPGASLAGERCVAVSVSCPDGAQWDGATCVAARSTGGDAAPAEEGPSIVGEYAGDIVMNGKATSIQTRLSSIHGSIVGDYVYGPQHVHGRLSGCRVADRALTCTWHEADLSGPFRVQLGADELSFSGTWDFADGRTGGTWTGRRRLPGQAAAVVAAPQGPPPPSAITGVYRGTIGVGQTTGPVVTRLDTSTGRVTGSYKYGSAVGQLSDCQLSGRQLVCTWTEGGGTGPFRVKFAPDFASFQGSWDLPDGQSGGVWSGSR